jgi:hypothetical protein
MFFRLMIFKVVFLFLVIASAIWLAVREGATLDNPTAAAGSFRRYPFSLGCGCAAVAGLAAFGNLLLPGRRKAALPTYSDEEFLARFGGQK